MKSVIVKAVSQVPGVLSDPAPEALVLDLTDPEANAVKMRVLWWTKAPRQHEMLTSYDRVLTKCNQASAEPRYTQQDSRCLKELWAP